MTLPIGAPDDATHVWYHSNGTPRAWLKVGEWVYTWHGGEWVAVAKHINNLSGKVVAL